MLRLALICALLAGPAAAGAWPRETGSAFVSGAFRFSTPRDTLGRGDIATYSSLYLEYGLAPRLTAGLDTGRAISGKDKTVVFLRWPLGRPEARNRLALELGAGQIDAAGVIRPGLSWGRGLSVGDAGGWMAADALAEIRTDGRGADFKLDLTLGLTHESGRHNILQLQTGRQRGDDPFARLEASVVLPARRGLSLEMGLIAGMVNDNSLGLKLGFWREF